MADIGIRVLVLGVAEARRGISTVQGDLTGLEKTIRGLSGTASTIGQTMTSVGNAISGLGRTLTLTVTGPIVALGGALLNAGLQFEDAFAGVTKTVDGLATPMGDLTQAGLELRQQFVDLSTTIPVSPDQLAALGQLAGQFGQTKDTVIDMVEVLAELRETTDLVSEGHQRAFAQIAKIVGLASDEYDNFASALVFLGNHFPTTESRITDFTERIIGTADALGISLPAVLAWGAAVTSSGIQAETGATAIRKAFMEMSLAVTSGGNEVVNFANTVSIAFEESGLSAEEFTQKFGLLPGVLNDGKISAAEFGDIFKRDASGALQLFLEGLSHLSATEQIRVLDELGLSAQRVGSTLQNLASNTDLLSDALSGSQRAFEEGIALQEEFVKRTSTLKSSLQILKNQFVALGIKVFDVVEGDLKKFILAVGDIIDRISHVDPATIRFAAAIALVAAAVGPVLVIIGTFITALGGIVTAVAALATPVGAAVLGIGALGAALSIAFGPAIIAQIQDVISKISEIASFVLEPIFNVPEAPPAPTTPEGGHTVSDSILDRREMQPMVIPPPDSSAFEEAMDRLNSVIPQSVKDMAQSLIDAFTSISKIFQNVAALVGPALSSFVTPIVEIAGPELTEAFTSISETLGSFGLTWGDVFSAIGTVVGTVVVVILGLIVGLVTGVAAGLHSLANTISNVKDGLALIFDGMVRIVAGFFVAAIALIEGNRDKFNQAIGAIFAGNIEVVGGLLSVLTSLVMGAVDLILSVLFGFAEGVVSFFVHMAESMGVEVSQGVQDVLSFLTNLRTEGLDLLRSFVDQMIENIGSGAATVASVIQGLVADILGYFEEMFDALIGHSIIPDMVSGIIREFGNLKDVVVGLANTIKKEVIDKFGELATKAGDLLKDIFGGGGGDAKVALPTFDIEPLNAVKLALQSLQLESTNTTNAFAAMVQAAITQIATLQTSVSTAMSAIQMALSSAVQDMQTTWAGGLTRIASLWSSTFSQAMSVLASFESGANSSFARLLATFATTVSNLIIHMKLWQTQYTLLRASLESESLKIIGAIAHTIAFVDAFTGAFKLLEAEAMRAASIVCKSYQDMATCAANSYSDQTGSPELKIQHPFETFERFLKTASFDFNMDTSPVQKITERLAGEIPGQSSVDNSRSNSISATFGDIIGTPLQDKEDLATLLEDRMRLIMGQ